MVRPLQTLSNLLAALREEDFSFRARTSRKADDALAQAMREVNMLADTLREQRLGALEATALLRKVMEEIDVAVFAFDGGAACAWSTGPGSGCWAGRRSASSARRPASWGWPRRCARTRRACWSSSFPGGARAAGRCAAARSARAALPHWTCWCSPT